MNGKLNRHGTTRLRFAALVLGLAVLTGAAACSTGNKGPQVSATATPPATSPEAGPGTAESTTAASGTASSPASPATGSTNSPSQTASPAATALSWKTYTDPARTISFELPQDWVAQSLTPEAGSMPGALKVEVKDAEGRYIATLQTGLPPADAAACPAAQSRPYVVISSVPLDVQHSQGPDTIDPRVVYRVIQGYRFFGSYGITNVVAGADGQSCELRNRVLGPAGKGDFSFGDVPTLRAFAPDERVAPAKAFDTLDLAAKYVAHGSEFANVQRMLLSLKVNL